MPPPPQLNGGKVTPNLAMDAAATRLLNLTVLQRLDPAVEDILITAAHVTLYDFNIDLNQWVSHRSPPRALHLLDPDPIRHDLTADYLVVGLFRAEPEGRRGVAVRRQEVRVWVGGFACARMRSGSVLILLDWSRNSQPRFQFIVMNRRNTGTHYLWLDFLVCVSGGWIGFMMTLGWLEAVSTNGINYDIKTIHFGSY
jgi:hypothetical protein